MQLFTACCQMHSAMHSTADTTKSTFLYIRIIIFHFVGILLGEIVLNIMVTVIGLIALPI